MVEENSSETKSWFTARNVVLWIALAMIGFGILSSFLERGEDQVGERVPAVQERIREPVVEQKVAPVVEESVEKDIRFYLSKVRAWWSGFVSDSMAEVDSIIATDVNWAPYVFWISIAVALFFLLYSWRIDWLQRKSNWHRWGVIFSAFATAAALWFLHPTLAGSIQAHWNWHVVLFNLIQILAIWLLVNPRMKPHFGMILTIVTLELLLSLLLPSYFKVIVVSGEGPMGLSYWFIGFILTFVILGIFTSPSDKGWDKSPARIALRVLGGVIFLFFLCLAVEPYVGSTFLRRKLISFEVHSEELRSAQILKAPRRLRISELRKEKDRLFEEARKGHGVNPAELAIKLAEIDDDLKRLIQADAPPEPKRVAKSTPRFVVDEPGFKQFWLEEGEISRCFPIPVAPDKITWQVLEGEYMDVMYNRSLKDKERIFKGEERPFRKVPGRVKYRADPGGTIRKSTGCVQLVGGRRGTFAQVVYIVES